MLSFPPSIPPSFHPSFQLRPLTSLSPHLHRINDLHNHGPFVYPFWAAIVLGAVVYSLGAAHVLLMGRRGSIIGGIVSYCQHYHHHHDYTLCTIFFFSLIKEFQYYNWRAKQASYIIVDLMAQAVYILCDHACINTPLCHISQILSMSKSRYLF